MKQLLKCYCVIWEEVYRTTYGDGDKAEFYLLGSLVLIATLLLLFLIGLLLWNYTLPLIFTCLVVKFCWDKITNIDGDKIISNLKDKNRDKYIKFKQWLNK